MSAYAYFLETIVFKSDVHMLKATAVKTDPSGTPLLRCRNLLRLLLPMVNLFTNELHDHAIKRAKNALLGHVPVAITWPRCHAVS